MPPKTPIWKSIGRTRNRHDLPLPPIACPKKSPKIGGIELKEVDQYEKGGKETGREIYTEFILERGGDQRSFKLRPCGAKIATGDNRFQNGLPSYRHPCVPFLLLPLHLTHLPPPTLRRFPSLSYYFSYSFHYIVRFFLFLSFFFFLFYFLMSWCIDSRISATRSPYFPLHGLLTPTRSGSSRLSRHNPSPLHKGSELCV
jgi:hypothetical protein